MMFAELGEGDHSHSYAYLKDVRGAPANAEAKSSRRTIDKSPPAHPNSNHEHAPIFQINAIRMARAT